MTVQLPGPQMCLACTALRFKKSPVQLNRLLEAQGCCYAQQNSKGLQPTRAARCASTATHHVQSTSNYCIVIM